MILPALSADHSSLVVANVVTKTIVPRFAPFPAALSIVVLLAYDAVLVAEGGVFALFFVFTPLGVYIKPSLGHEALDQYRLCEIQGGCVSIRQVRT